MRPGRSDLLHGEQHAGHERGAVVGVVADREASGPSCRAAPPGGRPAPAGARSGRGCRPARPRPARPATTSCGSGRAPTSARPPAMRCTVIIAVPDGASALASWCSSITSAVSKYGAASSAKRIISTAPMAKLGATRQLLVVKALASSSRSAAVKPVVPTTAWTPWSAHQRAFSRAAASDREVDGHLDAGLGHGAGDRAPRRPRRRTSPAWAGSTAATSSRSGSAATASHTVVPIRPPAPNTPTRIVTTSDRTSHRMRYGLSLPNVGPTSELLRAGRRGRGERLGRRVRVGPPPPRPPAAASTSSTRG